MNESQIDNLSHRCENQKFKVTVNVTNPTQRSATFSTFSKFFQTIFFSYLTFFTFFEDFEDLFSSSIFYDFFLHNFLEKFTCFESYIFSLLSVLHHRQKKKRHFVQIALFELLILFINLVIKYFLEFELFFVFFLLKNKKEI